MVEAQYLGLVKHVINSHSTVDASQYDVKRLQGKEAVVTFVLDRSGNVSQVFVDRPSGVKSLDKLAEHIVAAGSYPLFPAAAWPGRPRHVFSYVFKFVN